ncbi:MAG: immune inhibitor A [Bacteroidetes bacterium]|nr:immune inhibitor A [Bacteroidota bacterium]
MNRILLLICLMALPFLGISQQTTFSRVRIYLDSRDAKSLLKTGVELNSYDLKTSSYTAELSQEELKLIAEMGFRYDVMIKDVQKYYLERNKSTDPLQKNTSATNDLATEWPVPAHFTLGTCGGFLTVDDMIAQLDQMRSLYPNLITIKHSISDTLTTIEGRPVYFVKISDNPDVAESEPQVLYTGMHHAREPIGMQHLLYYMWYLLENYATNPEVKEVVDNTEMYFVPVFNVDGYQYNIDTYPNGAGMWRKNRRDSGGGNFGVDVNRNYGYMWGYDDTGSSPDPASEVYRGSGPFSEPETRMMKYFCQGHDFKIALNYHSFSNLFLYAWGWSPDLTPDDATFSAYASLLTTENNFTYGPGYSTIYPTNGGSDDWMYGDQDTKPMILSYTPEIGTDADGFWPVEERIIPLCQENMFASFTAAKLVGKYGKISDLSPLFLYQDHGYLNFDVTRLGMQDGNFTASVIPLGNSFASIGSPVVLSGMNILEHRMDSISYELAPVNHVGDTLRYILVLDNGMYTVSDTIVRIYGYPFTLLSDKLNNKNNWTGTWNLTSSSYFSAPTSMTDSPSGNYTNNANKSITLTYTVPLASSLLTALEFRAHWALENDFDYVQVKVSDNGGTTWTPLSGRYTNIASINQPTGQPLYDGTQGDWVHEAISLNPWQGKNIKLRFTLVSDGGTTADGFYFDDILISNILDPTSLTEEMPAQEWLGIPSPNPADGNVRIHYLSPDSSGIPSLKVFAASGMQQGIIQLSGKEGIAEFSVKGWTTGVYYIRMETPGIPAQVRKLVVY